MSPAPWAAAPWAARAMAPIVERLLRGIEEISKLRDECDAEIEKVADSDPTIRLLRTVPGVGPLCAGAFAHVIRDPQRFKSGRLVAAYLGLVPSLYASGQTYIRGGITKHGNSNVRWLLHICATALMRTQRDTAPRRCLHGVETLVAPPFGPIHVPGAGPRLRARIDG